MFMRLRVGGHKDTQRQIYRRRRSMRKTCAGKAEREARKGGVDQD